MGMPSAQVAQPLSQQNPNGKGSSGKTSQTNMPDTTNSATSGQPQMGQPNTYSNTVGPWDNNGNQTQVQSGKGKGH